MILSDRAIIRAVAHGDIVIDPFRNSQLNPSSYDLTLGPDVQVYEIPYIYDVRKEPKTYHVGPIGPDGFVIRPGVGYLMHTVERVGSRKFVPVLDGKSSIGRLFLSVHHTAGFGDVGFFGQWTLEVTTHLHAIRVYPDMRIAQIRFHVIEGEIGKYYDGNYQGETATGPVGSKAWKQFKEDE